ncbi:MAG: hypothetical protein Q7S89_02240 [bacterium]|nr:hypothetical protein [bacterium]
MFAPYNRSRTTIRRVPLAGGIYLPLPLRPWVPGVELLDVPVDMPYVFADHGQPDLKIGGLTRLRRGTVLWRVRDEQLYARTQGFCYHASPWGIFDRSVGAEHVFGEYDDRDGGEFMILDQHRQAVWEMILTYFAYTALTNEEKYDARHKVLSLALILGSPRNPRKLQAQIQLLCASRGTDLRGRVLPQVFQASMAGARGNVTVRVFDIQEIERHLSVRSIALAQELNRIETIMLNAWRALTRIVRRWSEASPATSWKLERQIADLARVMAELDSVLVGPFPTAFDSTAGEIQEAVQKARDGKFADAVELLRVASNSIQFQCAQIQLYRRVRLPLSLLTRMRGAVSAEQVLFLVTELTDESRTDDAYPKGIIPRMQERLRDEGFKRPVLVPAITALELAASYLETAHETVAEGGHALGADGLRAVRSANASVRGALRL